MIQHYEYKMIAIGASSNTTNLCPKNRNIALIVLHEIVSVLSNRLKKSQYTCSRNEKWVINARV